jgi:hypothetical protein
MMKTKNYFFLSLLAAGLLLATSAQAGTAGLYVSPNTATKNVGDTMTITVGVAAADNEVYAVEGTLAFDNLTCQSITVAGGLTPQTSPSCASPSFLLGVPGGTKVSKTLLTVVVKATAAGTAKLTVTNVDIVGKGTSLSKAGASGSYTVNSTTQAPAATVEPEQEASAPAAAATTKKTTDTETGSETDAGALVSSTDETIATSTEGQVLAGYEENTSAEANDEVSEAWWNQTWLKVVAGLLVIGVIGFAGTKLFFK